MGLSNIQKRLKIKRRVRRNIHGTAERPRLSVFRSNKEIYAQLVDDNAGKTLVAASSREKGAQSGTKTDMAKAVGEAIASKAKDKGIETVVFDRNGFLYHGRIKALAEGARSGGLKF